MHNKYYYYYYNYLITFYRYDPHATQFIRFSQLSDFIASLDPPLGIPKPNTVALVSFNLPIAKGNKIHCLDILHALVKHVLGHVEETDNFRQVFPFGEVKVLVLKAFWVLASGADEHQVQEAVPDEEGIGDRFFHEDLEEGG